MQSNRIIPPNNTDAEESVIGSLLIDPESFYEIDGVLSAKDFYLSKHAIIFEVIEDLYRQGEPADLVLITEKLEARGKLADIGGVAVLTDFTSFTPTSIHLKYYANIVAAKSVERRLIEAAQNIVRSVASAEDEGESNSPEVMVSNAMSEITKVEQGLSVGGPKDIGDYASELMLEMDQVYNGGKEPGIPSGFKDLDKALVGFRNGSFYIMAGRPSMGKSGVAITMARNIAEQGKRVMIFSLEMPGAAVAARLAAQLSGVSTDAARDVNTSKEDQGKFLGGIMRAKELPIVIDDEPSLRMSVIRSRAKRQQVRDGLDFVIIDHCGLAQADKQGDEYREATDISHQCMALAKELNIPVLGLVQLNRGVENRQNKRPLMSDLRDSGHWEQDAYAIMLLYRDDYYNEKSDTPNVLEINLAKHRDGKLGRAYMYWRKHTAEALPLDVKTVPLDY
jgi:replicative DNA helicase